MAINNCINIFIGSKGLIANSLKKEFVNKKKKFFYFKGSVKSNKHKQNKKKLFS